MIPASGVHYEVGDGQVHGEEDKTDLNTKDTVLQNRVEEHDVILIETVKKEIMQVVKSESEDEVAVLKNHEDRNELHVISQDDEHKEKSQLIVKVHNDADRAGLLFNVHEVSDRTDVLTSDDKADEKPDVLTFSKNLKQEKSEVPSNVLECGNEINLPSKNHRDVEKSNVVSENVITKVCEVTKEKKDANQIDDHGGVEKSNVIPLGCRGEQELDKILKQAKIGFKPEIILVEDGDKTTNDIPLTEDHEDRCKPEQIPKITKSGIKSDVLSIGCEENKHNVFVKDYKEIKKLDTGPNDIVNEKKVEVIIVDHKVGNKCNLPSKLPKVEDKIDMSLKSHKDVDECNDFSKDFWIEKRYLPAENKFVDKHEDPKEKIRRRHGHKIPSKNDECGKKPRNSMGHKIAWKRSAAIHTPSKASTFKRKNNSEKRTIDSASLVQAYLKMTAVQEKKQNFMNENLFTGENIQLSYIEKSSTVCGHDETKAIEDSVQRNKMNKEQVFRRCIRNSDQKKATFRRDIFIESSEAYLPIFNAAGCSKGPQHFFDSKGKLDRTEPSSPNDDEKSKEIILHLSNNDSPKQSLEHSLKRSTEHHHSHFNIPKKIRIESCPSMDVPSTFGFQVVIMKNSKGFPLRKDNVNKFLHLLRSKIMKLIIENDKPCFIPQFFGFRVDRTHNWLILKCKDEDSLKWVLSLKPLNIHKSLEIVRFEEAPWRSIKICFTIRKDKPEVKRVIKILASQNRSLNVTHWQHVKVSQHRGGWTLHFLLTEYEAKQLDQVGWLIFFELGMIQVLKF